MFKRNKIAIERAIFAVISFILLSFLIIFGTFVRGGSYIGAGEAGERADMTNQPSSGISGDELHGENYRVTRLTFSGSVTPASMLGSNSYGTFNSALAEYGAEYFLASLSDVLDSDTLSVTGCNATLSDREDLTLADMPDAEWYLGSTSAATLFPLGGIDAVSLECSRIFDYGDMGYSDTKLSLEGAGVKWADRQNPVVTAIEGCDSTAWCGFYRMSECELDGAEAEVLAEIRSASEAHEFVALYVTDIHEGAEPCEKKQRLFKLFVDSGADLVVGSNSINLQKAEKYGDGLIVYSLGALLDGATKYPEKYTALLSVTLVADEGEYLDAEYKIIPCTAYSEGKSWHPEIVDDEGAENEVYKLTLLTEGEI